MVYPPKSIKVGAAADLQSEILVSDQNTRIPGEPVKRELVSFAISVISWRACQLWHPVHPTLVLIRPSSRNPTPCDRGYGWAEQVILLGGRIQAILPHVTGHRLVVSTRLGILVRIAVSRCRDRCRRRRMYGRCVCAIVTAAPNSQLWFQAVSYEDGHYQKDSSHSWQSPFAVAYSNISIVV